MAGAKPTIYKWVLHPGGSGVLRSVGILPDGTLHNPNGYPEDLVRAAVEAANERRRKKRSEAAAKAAATRAARRERKVAEVVAKLKAGGHLSPGDYCEICKKHLDDPESVERGIGSDCWQHLLSLLAEAAGTLDPGPGA